jgi:hypothetical protein
MLQVQLSIGLTGEITLLVKNNPNYSLKLLFHRSVLYRTKKSSLRYRYSTALPQLRPPTRMCPVQVTSSTSWIPYWSG